MGMRKALERKLGFRFDLAWYNDRDGKDQLVPQWYAVLQRERKERTLKKSEEIRVDTFLWMRQLADITTLLPIFLSGALSVSFFCDDFFTVIMCWL